MLCHLSKKIGAVDVIMSIKTHLKGAFGSNGFLDLSFFSWKKYGMMYKNGLDLF